MEEVLRVLAWPAWSAVLLLLLLGLSQDWWDRRRPSARWNRLRQRIGMGSIYFLVGWGAIWLGWELLRLFHEEFKHHPSDMAGLAALPTAFGVMGLGGRLGWWKTVKQLWVAFGLSFIVGLFGWEQVFIRLPLWGRWVALIALFWVTWRILKPVFLQIIRPS